MKTRETIEVRRLREERETMVTRTRRRQEFQWVRHAVTLGFWGVGSYAILYHGLPMIGAFFQGLAELG